MLRQNFMVKAIAVLLFLGLISFPCVSRASFFYEEKPPEKEKREASEEKEAAEKQKAKKREARIYAAGASISALTQIGSGVAEKKSSRGHNVRLPLAIELISPDGWDVNVSEEIREEKISWQNTADESWVRTLEEAGRREGLHFVVNWRDKEITSARGEIKIPEKKAEPAQEPPQESASKTAKKPRDSGKKSPQEPGENILTRKAAGKKPQPGKKGASEEDEKPVIRKLNKEYRPERGVIKKGNLEKSIKSYFGKYDYKVVVRTDFEDELWLSSPVYVPGSGLLEDVESLSESLRGIQGYVFKFSQYKKNKYLVLDVKEI